MTNVVPGAQGGQSIFAKFADIEEQYGAHVVEKFLARLHGVEAVLDIGAGSGRDLGIVAQRFAHARKLAVEFNADNIARLRAVGVETFQCDLEKQRLPAADESLDLVVANQVLEHMKEIFWIWHEISRALKVGGHFVVGVPNVTSFHNRILMLAGGHPTQWKSYSAHVRPFSKPDTLRFCDVCWRGGYELVGFSGAQFYPFPRALSRVACSVWPSAAAFIFFLFRKARPYNGEFLEHPRRAQLETNFFLGK